MKGNHTWTKRRGISIIRAYLFFDVLFSKISNAISLGKERGSFVNHRLFFSSRIRKIEKVLVLAWDISLNLNKFIFKARKVRKFWYTGCCFTAIKYIACQTKWNASLLDKHKSVVHQVLAKGLFSILFQSCWKLLEFS